MLRELPKRGPAPQLVEQVGVALLPTDRLDEQPPTVADLDHERDRAARHRAVGKGKKGKRPRAADLLECLRGLPILGAAAPNIHILDAVDGQDAHREEPLMRIVASVNIDRPASQVWAYVADYATTPAGAPA